MKRVCVWFLATLAGAMAVEAAGQPQWGERHSRNMVSSETGLPESFDPATGENIKWSAPLGSDAYASPVIAGGKVLIGGNNAEPRDPRHEGDRAVLLCLDENDGSLCWQLVVPRLEGDRFLDWPEVGMCSPPTVEGDRVYTMTNRCEVVCLDLNGQADGNDGPYKEEGAHMAPRGEAPMDVTPLDADIIWLTDLREAVDIWPHDSAHSSILLDGPYLYTHTCNGVDNTHRVIRKPDAPSLVVLDKETGRIVAQDGERMGPGIFHATWSSPAMGEVNGAKQVIFAGGNGVLYGFEPPAGNSAESGVQTLKRIWRFDPDPAAPKEDLQAYLKNLSEGPSSIKGMPVFHEGRVYFTVGGDIWWGKKQAWLKCLDPSGSGDITESAEIWSYPVESHCCSTPSVWNGLVFVGDCRGLVHCVDAATGEPYWTHQMANDIWGSTLAADGKVYVGSRGRDFCILAASKEKKVVSSVEFPARVSSTPVAANGTLYVATMERLYAIQAGGAE